MAEAHLKKQQIMDALTDVRIQLQNEVAHPGYETALPGIDQKSSVGMGQLRCYFRLASISRPCA